MQGFYEKKKKICSANAFFPMFFPLRRSADGLNTAKLLKSHFFSFPACISIPECYLTIIKWKRKPN